MTETIYQTDSYAQEFTATVTAIDTETVIAIDTEQNGVLLDRTVFYPGGGGQPADKGQLVVGDKVYTVSKPDAATCTLSWG